MTTVAAPETETETGTEDAAPLATPLRLEYIELTRLTSHPGNVRKDLKITDRFRRSVRRKLETPLTVTALPGGDYRVIDGHRRLLVMVEDEWKTAPCIVDQDAAEDEASQFVTMFNTGHHRQGLTAIEEATALFSAAGLGASVKRLADEIGWTQKDVKSAVQVARADATREAAETIDYPWTLDDLAALHEFEDDGEAFSRLLDAAERRQFAAQVKREKNDRAMRAKLAKEREVYEAAGIKVLDSYDDLPDTASSVWRLTDADRETHETCPGHLIAPARYDEKWSSYCADPEAHHSMPGSSGTGSGSPKPKKADPAVRAHVIQGNKDWTAATDARHDWLKALMTRKTWPKEHQLIMARFVGTATLRGGDLTTDATHDKARALLAAWYGLSVTATNGEFGAIADKIDPRRLNSLPFGALAASHEKSAMDTRTWRRADDKGWTTGTRVLIGAWLKVCRELGHNLTPIEEAVISGQDYVPGPKAPEPGQEPSAPDSGPKALMPAPQ